MVLRDFTAQRLYVESPLDEGASLPCAGASANYLLNVLRMNAGDSLLVFNGRDGEWRVGIASVTKRGCRLEVRDRVRAQEAGPDIAYLFAPLKRARLDYMVQKAVELGVSRLEPVMTAHTVAERVNIERMRANAIEAAEQCGILTVPAIVGPRKLSPALAALEPGRPLIVCDEAAEVADPIAALRRLQPGPVALLIGPEGGFAAGERAMILARPGTLRLSLGPRIMRADTAACAALALVNAVLGDWR